MKKKKKLIGTVISLALAIAFMGFGVYAATSVTSKMQSSISFVSKDVKCTFAVDVDGGKYLSGGVGTDEQEYRHKSQSVDNESVNASHTLSEFSMGHYTFDPTTEAGKKIKYTITITNDGSNEIKIKYIETKMFESINNILKVTKTNMQNIDTVAVGDSCVGTIELELLDGSADIQVKDLEISFEIKKAGEVSSPIKSFDFGTPTLGEVSITKYKGTESEVILPSKDGNGNAITSIGVNAFNNNNKITSVTIPNSVTSIGYAAFNNCTNLANINISDSLISVGADAFSGTKWNNNLPNGLVYLGKVLYRYSGVCPSEINDVKDDVVAIAPSAFSNCNELVSISIPSSVKSIGASAFQDCSLLANINIPNGITQIEGSTFQNCFALNSIIIPNTVKSIGNYAFAFCNSLSEITIPSSVTNINMDSFFDCGNIRKVICEGNILLKYAFSYYYSITTIEILEGTTSISAGAFAECSGIESVSFPSSLSTIESYAFDGCRSLTEINIPNSVTKIGGYAFRDCVSLTELNIPDGVEIIEEYAFKNCTTLSIVNIGKNVNSLATEYYNLAFADCTSLMEINVDPNNYSFSSDNGILLDKYKTTILFCPQSRYYEYIVPNSVRTIKAYAFNNCRYFSGITMGGFVDNIEEYAFANCSSMMSVMFNNNPYANAIIGDYAFSNCTSVVYVSLDYNVATIGVGAFKNCSSLPEIKITSSVTEIKDEAFSGCSSLEIVNFERTETFTSLGNNCFGNLKNGSVLIFSNQTVMDQFIAEVHYTSSKTSKTL